MDLLCAYQKLDQVWPNGRLKHRISLLVESLSGITKANSGRDGLDTRSIALEVRKMKLISRVSYTLTYNRSTQCSLGEMVKAADEDQINYSQDHVLILYAMIHEKLLNQEELFSEKIMPWWRSFGNCFTDVEQGGWHQQRIGLAADSLNDKIGPLQTPFYLVETILSILEMIDSQADSGCNNTPALM